MADSAVINSDVNEEVSVEIAEKRVFTKTEKIYAFVVMLLAFLWMQFQISNPAGFITTAVNIAIITVSIVFLKKQGCGFSPVNRVITAVLYAFSLVFSITDNGLIKFLVGVFLFAAGAYLVYSVGEGKREIEKYLPIAIVKAVFG
jgi:ABC-type Na+ efflux pump permease subunit